MNVSITLTIDSTLAAQLLDFYTELIGQPSRAAPADDKLFMDRFEQWRVRFLSDLSLYFAHHPSASARISRAMHHFLTTPRFIYRTDDDQELVRQWLEHARYIYQQAGGKFPTWQEYCQNPSMWSVRHIGPRSRQELLTYYDQPT